jgi:hypothetical protein
MHRQNSTRPTLGASQARTCPVHTLHTDTSDAREVSLRELQQRLRDTGRMIQRTALYAIACALAGYHLPEAGNPSDRAALSAIQEEAGRLLGEGFRP